VDGVECGGLLIFTASWVRELSQANLAGSVGTGSRDRKHAPKSGRMKKANNCDLER